MNDQNRRRLDAVALPARTPALKNSPALVRLSMERRCPAALTAMTDQNRRPLDAVALPARTPALHKFAGTRSSLNETIEQNRRRLVLAALAWFLLRQNSTNRRAQLGRRDRLRNE